MTWTPSASGSQLAVIGTQHFLTTDTTNGTYYYEVDVSPLLAGDILTLRIYVKTLSGSTLQVAWASTYGPAPPVNKIVPSPPQPVDQSIQISLQQTAGTGRTFGWKLLRI